MSKEFEPMREVTKHVFNETLRDLADRHGSAVEAVISDMSTAFYDSDSLVAVAVKVLGGHSTYFIDHANYARVYGIPRRILH